MVRDPPPEHPVLAALSAEMPIFVLTPRSWAELAAVESYVAALQDPVAREEGHRQLRRMKRYAQDHVSLQKLPAEPTRESA